MEKGILRFFDSVGKLMALIIKKEHNSQGINFLTTDELYMQVAEMSHLDGHIIEPHYHNKIDRIISYTCETLIIKKGTLEVFLYEKEKLIHRFSITEGDILILYNGGHGFKCLGDVSMVEIKQGPFIGPNDKTRFKGGLN